MKKNEKFCLIAEGQGEHKKCFALQCTFDMFAMWIFFDTFIFSYLELILSFAISNVRCIYTLEFIRRDWNDSKFIYIWAHIVSSDWLPGLVIDCDWPVDLVLTHDWEKKYVAWWTSMHFFWQFTDRADILWHVTNMSPTFATKLLCWYPFLVHLAGRPGILVVVLFVIVCVCTKVGAYLGLGWFG